MAKNVGNPDGHTSYRISTPPDQGGEQGLGEDSSDGLELSASTSTPPLTSQGHRQTTDSVGSASHRGVEPTWHTHTTSSRAVAHGSQAAAPRPRGNHSASRSSRKPAAAPQQADPVDVEEDLLAAFEKELFRESTAVAVPGSPIPLQDLTTGGPIDDKNPLYREYTASHCTFVSEGVGRESSTSYVGAAPDPIPKKSREPNSLPKKWLCMWLLPFRSICPLRRSPKK